ncbi:hypothetical protein GIB67_035242 [Kingdonia uniflora]|uniref:RRM domain-containing protein n=1 Tax=Kingdonia uniflora TaxID=39325 RepID=A0A7J7KXS6_9MAGN|nr:hypothetical protein GIB67_035242 [Kingdonia uniflora]
MDMFMKSYPDLQRLNNTQRRKAGVIVESIPSPGNNSQVPYQLDLGHLDVPTLPVPANHIPLSSVVNPALFLRFTCKMLYLSYATSETSLRKEFSNFGQVAEVKLIKDEGGKRSRGYAFIQYTSQDDAMLALENLDRKLIQELHRSYLLSIGGTTNTECNPVMLPPCEPPIELELALFEEEKQLPLIESEGKVRPLAEGCSLGNNTSINSHVTDREKVQDLESQHIASRFFINKTWRQYNESDATELDTSPMWMNFKNIPFHMWDKTGVSKIASYIGILLSVDKATEEGTQMYFEKVNVEVKANVALPNTVPVKDSSNKITQAKVQLGAPDMNFLECLWS